MPPDKSLLADYLILVGPRRPGFDHLAVRTCMGAQLGRGHGMTFRFDIGSCHRLCSVD
jgi:hypothetical protein